MDSKSICSIAYGIQLDGDLDAKATDPNTGNLINKPFVYTDEAGNVVTTTSVLSIGTHTLTATFTPTDTANCTSGGTVTNSITVTQAPPTKMTPTLTWTPKPLAEIVYGTALGADLNATATYNGQTVPGNFVYTDETGAVVNTQSTLSVGTHTLTATFTPTDTTYYTSGGTIQNSITINSTAENEKNDRDHNGRPNNGGCGIDFEPNYGAAFVPVPMMYKSPIFGSEPYGYGSGPSTTETPNSDSNGHKAKAHLSKHKHKHKHNTTKHYKTGKSLSIKVDKNSWIFR